MALGALGNGFGRLGAVPQAGSGVSPEVAQFLARTSGLNALHVAAYTALIDGLVEDGIWTLLDLLQVYATQDQTTANLNLVSSSFTATPQGSPTWGADVGYTTAQNKYVQIGMAPNGGAQFTQNSAHISAWSGSTAATFYYVMMVETSSAANQTKLLTRDMSGNASASINDSSVLGGLAVADASGHYVVNRPDATTRQIYKNGSLLGEGTRASLTPQSQTLTVGGSDATNGSRYAGITRAVSAGAELTPAQVSAFYSRLAAYMLAIGASP